MGWKDSPEDREIARLLKEAVDTGDKASEKKNWAAIYQKYHQSVLKFATRRVSRNKLLHAVDPQDIASEVFIEVRNSIASYDQQRPFHRWIMGIAVNCTRRARFKYLKILKQLAGIAEAIGTRDTKQDNEPIEEALARMLIEKLHNYFISIGKEVLFKILELKYFHEMSDLGIAVSLGEVETSDTPKHQKAAAERIRQWRAEAEELASRFLSEDSSIEDPEGLP